MILYIFIPVIPDKDRYKPVLGKAGNTNKEWKLSASYIEVTSLLTTPNAKAEEDATAGRTGFGCK